MISDSPEVISLAPRVRILPSTYSKKWLHGLRLALRVFTHIGKSNMECHRER